MLADPAQARCARVALGDRVRRDQAERAALAQQVECAAEEVRDEVGVAVTAFVDRLAASRGSRRRVRCRDLVPAQNGGLPTIASKPGCLAVEHLGELDLPVEAARAAARPRAQLSTSPRCSASRRSRTAIRSSCVRRSSRSLAFAPAKNASDDEVADQAHLVELVLRLVARAAAARRRTRRRPPRGSPRAAPTTRSM